MSVYSNPHIDNLIVSQLKELEGFESSEEFESLYKDIEHEELKNILIILHTNLSKLFKDMNTRLPTQEDKNYYWADDSRSLIKCIDVSFELYYKLKETSLAIKIDDYYFDLFKYCRDFLAPSRGSYIPAHMSKVNIYYRIPIFTAANTVEIHSPINKIHTPLKYYDEGSYAIVYKYKDKFYNRHFIIKRAKQNLTDKEIERFEREYSIVKSLSSPYIVEVFNYNSEKNEYTMEFMDYNLYKYIKKNNGVIKKYERKRIVHQILKAFEYVHSQNLLHRDINPNNILLKKYDDESLVVKLSDFGLVKIEGSNLTALDTEFKGSFNDPALRITGFSNYSIYHEIYALCYTIYFIMTGKKQIENCSNEGLNTLVKEGLNENINSRPKSVKEVRQLFSKI